MEMEIMQILNELKPGEVFEENASLIDDGLLDSFDIITLISILEERYKVIIDGLDIVPENFQSVKSISDLIMKSTKA